MYVVMCTDLFHDITWVHHSIHKRIYSYATIRVHFVNIFIDGGSFIVLKWL